MFVNWLSVFFGKMTIQGSSAHFFFLIGLFAFWFWVEWTVYIIWIITLCHIFCKYFLPFCMLSFTFLIILQKLLSLIRAHLFISAFIYIFFALRYQSKKMLLWLMSENDLPIFFSKRFMVSCLIPRSLNNFNFIFAYSVSECLNFILLHVAIQLFWASLVAQTEKNLQKTWVRSLGWEDPLEEGVATHFNIVAWRIPMDIGAWRATVHDVAKSWTQPRD